MPHQDLLDFGRLAELLGYDRKVSTLDFPVSSRGYRARADPAPAEAGGAADHPGFRRLEEVLAASDGDLEAVEESAPVAPRTSARAYGDFKRSTRSTST